MPLVHEGSNTISAVPATANMVSSKPECPRPPLCPSPGGRGGEPSPYQPQNFAAGTCVVLQDRVCVVRHCYLYPLYFGRAL